MIAQKIPFEKVSIDIFSFLFLLLKKSVLLKHIVKISSLKHCIVVPRYGYDRMMDRGYFRLCKPLHIA